MTDKAELIKKRVTDQLFWDNRVDASDIEIAVDGTKVKLKGKVPSYTARERAILDAWTVQDVTKVENELDIEYPSIIEIPDDDEIKTRIEQQLFWNTYIDSTDIDIDVDNGTVELEGTTDAYWKKLRAEQLASDVTGVVLIDNKIAVVPSESIVDKIVAENIIAAMERNPLIDPDSVTVTVDQGKATLSGTVSHWTAYRAAMDAAEFATGVIKIEDQIVIE
ncbi:MAG: BON domain-containing protein [Candidatus Lokiarchaeota archaeon]|nr:BON domain-containing protein [Candidatus Lokiarchaeota archaeon]